MVRFVGKGDFPKRSYQGGSGQQRVEHLLVSKASDACRREATIHQPGGERRLGLDMQSCRDCTPVRAVVFRDQEPLGHRTLFTFIAAEDKRGPRIVLCVAGTTRVEQGGCRGAALQQPK